MSIRSRTYPSILHASFLSLELLALALQLRLNTLEIELTLDDLDLVNRFWTFIEADYNPSDYFFDIAVETAQQKVF